MQIEPTVRVVCVSCQFRYPKIRGFCPMCGAAVPEEPVSTAIRESHRKEATASGGRDRFSRWWKRKQLIPALLLPILLLVYAWEVWSARTANVRHVTSPQATPLSAAQPFAPAPNLPVPQEEPALMPDGVSHASEVDPIRPRAAAGTPTNLAELWNQVRHGNTQAEVALAQLYIDGNRVERNCDQAHLLLAAAVGKGNKQAGQLLTGSYHEHCSN
jgi:TPR repeat protein